MGRNLKEGKLVLKKKSFFCSDDVWEKLQTIVESKKIKGEQSNVSDLLRRGALRIIKNYDKTLNKK